MARIFKLLPPAAVGRIPLWVGVLAGVLAACSGCEPEDFNTSQQPLTAKITAPAMDSHFTEGELIEFIGQVSNPNKNTDDITALNVTLTLNGVLAPVLDAQGLAVNNVMKPDSQGTVSGFFSTAGLGGEEFHALEMTVSGSKVAAPGSHLIAFSVSPNAVPGVQILSPDPSRHLYAGTSEEVVITFQDGESHYSEVSVALFLNDVLLNDRVRVTAGETSYQGEAREWVVFQEGDYQRLSARVTDHLGKEGWADLILQVGPPNSAPDRCDILAPDSDTEIQEGEQVLLRGVASDADQAENSLSFRWYDGQFLVAEGNPTSAGDISYTLTNGLTAGPHVLTLTVTDEAGSVCESQRDLNVLGLNLPPEAEVLSPVENSSSSVAYADESFNLKVQARDREDTEVLPIQLSADNVPIVADCSVPVQGTVSSAQETWNATDYACVLPASAIFEDLGVDETVSLLVEAWDSRGLKGSDWVDLLIRSCLKDSDRDGYSVCEEQGCDDDPNIHPGRVEVCDGVDNNCDGIIDGDAVNQAIYYYDNDRDGYGNCAVGTTACAPPSGYVSQCNDCDDMSALASPGLAEQCGDGIDNNCDGQIDENSDADLDGVAFCRGDCDDSSAYTHPGAPEICDGRDNNCDGILPEDEVDSDGDGVISCTEPGCDSNPNVYPDALEICNGVDDNCDGVIPTDEVQDADGDGYVDCLEEACKTDPARNPGVAEKCNGIDDNCDGGVDEGLDVDLDGFLPCIIGDRPADCDDSNPAIYPGAMEVCDGIDANCDGLADTDSEFDEDGDGFPGCIGDCDDQNPDVFPGGTEGYDGLDNDCDGETDDLLVAEAAAAKYEGVAFKQYAGTSMSGVGDINGDGMADFIIGVPRYEGTSPSGQLLSGIGRAYLFKGTGSAPESSTIKIAEGNAAAWFTGFRAEDEAGRTVAGVGDLNGDGLGDFAVGAPFSRGSQSGSPALSGTTYLFFGCRESNGPCLSGALTPNVTYQGEAVEDHSGASIAPAGDVNCDGYDDLLIGAPDHKEGEKVQAGKVYLIFGKPSGWPSSASLSTADVHFLPENGDSRLGTGLASLPGDLNGDGCDDVVLGAPTPSGSGKAYVLYGRPTWPTPFSISNSDLIFTGDAGNIVGTTMALGDLNGDGFDDLVVGAPSADQWATESSEAQVDVGQAYIVYGHNLWGSGIKVDLEDSADLVLEGTDQPEQFGNSLAAGQDVNGDGYEDLLIGAPTWSATDYYEPTHRGRAYLFHGAPDFYQAESVYDVRRGVGVVASWFAAASFAGGTPGYPYPNTDPMNGIQVGTQVALVGDLYRSANEPANPVELMISSPLYDAGVDYAGVVFVVAGVTGSE